MKRILYNIGEWVYNLYIHQQVIYALALMTPMLVGSISGNVIACLCGIVFFYGGLRMNDKGEATYKEGLAIELHYHHKYIYFNQAQALQWKKDRVNEKKVDLIGKIMLEKIVNVNNKRSRKKVK